ncbi:MAG: amidohydrolase family protein [Egibacteraceae bacterium]
MGGASVTGGCGRLRVFDAHLHIVDPRFPLAANQGYVPEPFTVADYRARAAGLRVVGGAVVSGSFQAFDQAYLVDALRRLGPGFVGVTQLPATVGDERIRRLDAAGVRAVRLNLFRGGDGGIDDLARLGHRVAELAGWHAELYVDARDLPELAPWLGRLPQLVVDHLGLSREGLPALLDLVERGARVKASGFSRGDLDVPAALRSISAVNPEALMFGTDLPSTRAPRPFADADVDVILDTLGDGLGGRVLHGNAAAFYLSRR